MPGATRTKSYYLWLLKIAAVVASIWFIHRQVVARDDFWDTLHRYGGQLLGARSLGTAAILLILTAVNWWIEAVKWRFLVGRILPLSPGRSVRAVLSGITVSFFTPNRIGEYAGRVLHLPKAVRLEAAVATVVGSMNQLLITVVAGGAALLFVLPDLIRPGAALVAAMAAVVIGMAGATGAYFNLAVVYRLTSRSRLGRKVARHFVVLERYRKSELARLTVWSSLRYVVFTAQFMLLLALFGVDVAAADAVRQIALSFLFLSVVPTFALTELTVRGSVALLCLEPLSADTAGILAASFSLWFINLVLPAVAGAITFLFSNPKRKESP